MAYEKEIAKYYQGIEAQSYEEVIKLFSKDAVIIHPIFGDKPASEFFKMLLERATKAHKIHIKNQFSDPKEPGRVAVYFTADAVKTTEGNDFEIKHSVHIFDFSKSGTIEQMIVIFDTYPMRKFFEHVTT